MRYLFGPYTLDTPARALRCADIVVPLEPKAYHVLVYLIEQRHRQVTRTELLERLWADAYVDDSVVSRCIVALRRALGDSSETQQTIQTRRGYGYRFVAPVVCQEGPVTDAVVPPSLPVPPAPLAEALLAVADPVVPPPAASIMPPPEPLAPLTYTWATLSDERKLVTVLCCRLSATATAAEGLDLDEQHALLQAFFALATPEVERYGGTMQSMLGAGFLALFGAPSAYEDHAPRAVLAALGVREHWRAQRTEVGGPVGEILTLHLGVHTGPIVINHTAGAAPLPYTAGDTTMLAMRLAQDTVPGTIALSATTAQLVAHTVRVEALGPGQLPSGTLPIPAYHVLGVAPQRSPMAPRGERVLHTLLAQVEQGRGQVVGLVGEPGIGKSRLLYEFRRSVQGRRVTYLTGRCVSYGSTTPYLPILDLVHQHWGITETDAPESIRDKIHRGLLDADMAPETWAPGLCQLLDAPDDTTAARLSPEAFKYQLHEALQQISLHGSRRQLMVFEIEDLHWIDPSSEAYLTAFTGRLPGAAILLLLTYRPGYRPPWMDKSYATQIALQPLGPQASQRTVRTLLHPRPEADALLPVILAKANGNPFFLEELARVAVAHEAPPSRWAVPDTIQAVLAARIDQLSAMEKRVLQTAAVLGVEVPILLLQAVTTLPEADLQPCLEALRTAEFLYESRLLPDQTYTFTHVLVQEVAVQSLLRRTRQQLHQHMAEVLAAHFPNLAAAQPERLARHYAEAGRREEAIDAWQQAGQRAVERSAYAEALAHLTQALDTLKTLPVTPARAERELAALSTLGPALVATRGLASPEVEQTYARARLLCEQVGETPRRFPTLRGLCQFYLGRGALPTARDLGEQLCALAQRAAEPTLLLEAQDALGTTLFLLGEYAAAWSHLAPTIALIDPTSQPPMMRHHDVSPAVRCLAIAANTLWCLGYPAQAVRRQQEALALAQSLNHPYSLAQAHYWTAFLQQRRGDAPAVQAQAEALMTIATAQGFPLWVGFGTCWRGWARAMQGQGAASLAQIHQGLTTVLATGQTQTQPLCLVLLAEAAGRLGQVEEALRLLAEALAAFATSGRGDLLAEAYRLQGAFLLQQAVPDVARAEACFQQALTIARRQQARAWELRAAMSLSRMWQRHGKRQAAYDLLASLYDWFTEGFDTADLQEASALLTELAP